MVNRTRPRFADRFSSDRQLDAAARALLDSGTLRGRERFRFVPKVPGTWAYFCGIQGSEETGTLTTF